MYYANYIANSKISNHINTKQKFLKDQSKNKTCIPDIKIYNIECKDTRHTTGFLATESHSSVLSLPLYTHRPLY